MMLDPDRVVLDHSTGRPIAPMAWRVFPFWIAISVAMAILLITAAFMALKVGDHLWATAASLISVFLLAFTEWRRRQIKRRSLVVLRSQEDYDRPREHLRF